MSESAPRYRIEPFGGTTDAPAPAAVLTALHTTLLQDSPVVGLGREFMEQFYYRSLPALHLIYGAVAYVEAGSVSWTAQAASTSKPGSTPRSSTKCLPSTPVTMRSAMTDVV